MKKVAEIPLVLDPEEVLVTDEHAEHDDALVGGARRDTRRGGDEIAVYRFAGEKIAEVWFWYDGYDQAAHDLVFSSDQRSAE